MVLAQQYRRVLGKAALGMAQTQVFDHPLSQAFRGVGGIGGKAALAAECVPRGPMQGLAVGHEAVYVEDYGSDLH